MELLLLPLGLLYLLLFLFVLLDFLCFLFEGGRIWIGKTPLVKYIIILFTNLYFFYTDVSGASIGDHWEPFSPDQRLSVYVVLVLGMAAHLYCMHRKNLAPPVMEVIVNCLLVLGAGLYGSFFIQQGNRWLSAVCPLPAMLLFIMMLWENHTKAVNELGTLCTCGELPLSKSWTTQFCWFLLQQKVRTKFPVLLMLCLPLLLCVVAVLLLFDQKSDLLVRVFTEI